MDKIFLFIMRVFSDFNSFNVIYVKNKRKTRVFTRFSLVF